MTEYIIWGIAPNTDSEQPLHTKSTTREQAERVAQILESKHGCTALRIQELDMGDANGLANTWRNVVN